MNWISGAGSLVALAAMLGACAHTPPATVAAQPQVRVVDTSCDWVKMLRPGCSDVIGDAFARQIIEHNQAGMEHCGWKKPAGAACPAK